MLLILWPLFPAQKDYPLILLEKEALDSIFGFKTPAFALLA